MADVRVTVDVEPILQFDNFTLSIENKLNELTSKPFKVDIKLDVSSEEAKIDALKAKLTSLKNPVRINTGDLLGRGTTANFEALSTSLNKVAGFLDNLGDTSSLKGTISEIKTLREEMTSLTRAMANGSNINFSLGGSPIARNAKYGASARRTIAQLREEASEIEKIFMELTNTREEINAVYRAGSRTEGILPKNMNTLYQMQNPTGTLVNQMESLRAYLKILHDIAAAKNIDISSVTSKYTKGADDLIADTEKVLDGTEDLEKGLQKFKDVFSSGLDAEALMQHLRGISESLTNISTILGDSDIGSDSFKTLRESVAETTKSIKDLQEAIANLNGTNVGPGDEAGGSGGGGGSRRKEKAKNGDYLKRLENDITKSGNNLEWNAARGLVVNEEGRDIDVYAAMRQNQANFKALATRWTNGRVRYDRLMALMEKYEGDMAHLEGLVTEAGRNYKLNGDKRTDSRIIKEGNAEGDKWAKQVSQFITAQQKNLAGATAANTGETQQHYTALVNAVSEAQTLQEALKGDGVELGNLTEKYNELERVATQSMQAIKAANRNYRLENTNPADSRIIRAGTSEGDKWLENISRFVDARQKYLAGATAANDGSTRQNYEALMGTVTSAKELEAALRDDGASVDYLKARFQQLKTVAQEAMTAINAAGKNYKLEDAGKILSKDTLNADEYREIEHSIQKSRQEAARLLNNYSAAGVSEDPSAKAAYADIEKMQAAMIALDTRFASGTMTVGEYNTAMATFASTMDKAKTAIVEAGENHKNPLIKEDEIKNAKQYATLIGQIQKQIDKMQKNLPNWSAAKTGRSSESYNTYAGIIPQLQDLMQKAGSGALTPAEVSAQFKALVGGANEAEGVMRSMNETTLSLGDRIKNVAQKFGLWFGASRVIIAVYNGIKKMVSASMEIESAMTRIQIVTGATDTQMTQFFETAAAQAKELGQSITDVAGSIETFSRLGYNLPEATELSKYATIMANVGDTTVDKATTGITSIIKGFGLQASDAEHVADVLINVGQKYAISAEELMEAFERGGAALAASGTSFEQSAGLLAATNAALQNASTTGTLWKTVSARIRGAKTELEELGESTDDLSEGFSKYRKEIKALTSVDIMVDDHTYKDMLTIFTELAGVWDKLDDTSRARVAEILGGTRNLSGIMSTINNIKDATDAYTVAMDSAGVATEANSMYMDTAAAHFNQLKASFQEFSADFAQSEFVKGGADVLTSIVNGVDAAIDKFGVLKTALAGIAIGSFLKSYISVSKEIGDVASQGTILAKSLSNPMFQAAGATVAFLALYDAINESLSEAADKAAKSRAAYEETSSEVESMENRLADVRDRISEINALGTITLTEKDELGRLQAENEELERMLALKREQKDLEMSGAARDAANVLTKEESKGASAFLETLMHPGTTSDLFGEAWTGNVIDYANYLLDAREEVEGLIKHALEFYDQEGADYYTNEVLPYINKELTQTLGIINDNEGALYDSTGQALDQYASIVSEVEALNKRIGKGSSEALSESLDILSDRIKEQAKFDALNVSPDKTRFGNINLNNRDAIEWTEDVISRYRRELESWGHSAEEMVGSISTVLGGSAEFDGKEIAFSPILQTDDGPILLGKDTVDSYIKGLIDNVKDENGNWSAKDLLKLDAEGLSVDGQIIRRLIADVGETAIKTGEAMHYLGEDGAMKDFIKGLEHASKLSKMNGKDFAKAWSKGDTDIEAIVNEFASMNEEFELTSDNVEALGNSLFELGAIGSDVAASFDELSATIDGFSEYQSKLNSAIASSKTATGLTKEEIQSLTNAYEDLEDFDPAKLFETTMNGIHLNEEELEKLNAEIENNKLEELYDSLNQKMVERQNLEFWGKDTSAIDKEIASTRQLISQYEGMTSAFNTWKAAQSGGTERDNYAAVGAGYEDMKKLVDQGWWGDESLEKYLELTLSAEKRTGDVEAQFKRLKETIDGTSHSLMDYWQYNKDNELVNGGVIDFIEDVRKVMGEAFVWDEEGATFFDFSGDKLEMLADRFGTTSEMVQLFERALIDAGYQVQLENLNMDNLGYGVERVRKQLLETQQSGAFDLHTNLDFNYDELEDLDVIQEKILSLESDRRSLINVEGAESTIKQIDDMLYGLQNREVMVKLNAAVDEQGLDALLAMDDQELTATLGIDTSQVEMAKQALATLSGEEVDTAVVVRLDDSQLAQLSGTEKTGTVTFEPDDKAIKAYTPDHKDAWVYYRPDTSQLLETLPPITRLVYLKQVGDVAIRNTDAYGTLGPARAAGSVSLDRDQLALVNELGTESLIRDGQWMLISGGMHQANLKKGDIVLSAAQTKALMLTGAAPGRGRALAEGTLLSNAYDAGSSGGTKKVSGTSLKKKVKSSGKSSGSGGRSSGGSSKGSGGSNDKSVDNELEIIDWIEVAIDRIERSISRLGIKATSTFNTLAKHLWATDKEIGKVNEEMKLQQRAYNRYVQQANRVGLAEPLAKLVRDGTIDIREYDKATADLIKEYQEWYEKALDCSDAIKQLREDLAELYENKFNDTKADFENQLSLLEHLTTTYENGIDYIDTRGYLATTKFYEAMRKVEEKNLTIQRKELSDLIARMSDAVNSGAIKKYSQSWYDMQQSINAVKEAIQETETEIVNLGNLIRETLWERFDYLQDLISRINDEADFLIKLMSYSDLFEDNGQLTNLGLSTMGLHGQNYNVYMNQADRYAEEIKKITAELANDPNNTKLIEQREEWLKSQREAILNAEDEKQAIVDLVEEGIRKELDALKELINTYEDSLDSAKNLYEYQKKVNDQAGEVAKLQKRLAAYQGDTSEESRATIQKLNVELKEAMENLQETQQDRALSEQKKMLDNMYDEYEEILNKRLDNVDLLIADMIEKINENSGTIGNTIAQEADDVGYTISESIRSIWAGDGLATSIITEYGDGFLSSLTSVTTVLNGIAVNVAKMAEVSDAEAKTTVSSATSSTSPNKQASKKAATSSAKKTTSNQKTGNGIVTPNLATLNDRLNVRNAPSASGQVIRQLMNGNLVETDWKEQNGWLHIRVHNSQEDYWGWVSKALIKAYAKGARHIGHSGYAWTQEAGSEAILRPSDNAILTKLKSGDSVLRAEATDNIFDFGNNPKDFLAKLGIDSANDVKRLANGAGVNAVDVGGISINIPIDHVSDYNDLVNQMRTDSRFEKLIQSMTVDRIVGGSKLAKTKYKW